MTSVDFLTWYGHNPPAIDCNPLPVIYLIAYGIGIVPLDSWTPKSLQLHHQGDKRRIEEEEEEEVVLDVPNDFYLTRKIVMFNDLYFIEIYF